MAQTNPGLKAILEEQGGEYQRYLDIVYEKFEEAIKVLGEGWNDARKKVNATFELSGEMKEDVEIIKTDIQFILTSKSV